ISAHPYKDAISAVKRGLLQGMGIALGFFGTTVFAVAISGTIKTWTSGEVLKSADLNTTISSMKTAIEGIPNWTKATNGTDAYYTAGNVGIGTTSPTSKFEVLDSTGGTDNISNFKVSSIGPYATMFIGGTSLGAEIRALNNATSGTNAATPLWVDSKSLTLRVGSDGNNINAFTISTVGNVGIGTTSPSANLHVVGTTLAAAWSTSDERYKKNIQNIPNPTEKILKLRGVNYEWRREEYKDLKFKAGQDFGFIGQEVEKVLPETIFKDEKGYLYVSYQTILPVLVEAFKKQKSLYENEKISSEKRLSHLEESSKKLRTDSEKLSILEESNRKLKTENRKLQELVEAQSRTSQRMEDRLNALEKMQIATAAAANAAQAKK
ncbi:MAG TPA: tail fiber domain-containing protein, partial [Leptospiraceae bacterium]|nr:tail fiber domain-containing protein [Leptospiraceae bacterium]